ncbi:hypothetical protein IJ541_08965 [bacterium]|nr:hypothetical protein [bacterium]MBQ9246011.1 hypothetical protein [bacterium]MBQ9246886.1 hypothetical protein [bacterium]
MPEIAICFFDLSQLFKLFPKTDRKLNHKIQQYELEIQENMAENRCKLFNL